MFTRYFFSFALLKRPLFIGFLFSSFSQTKKIIFKKMSLFKVEIPGLDQPLFIPHFRIGCGRFYEKKSNQQNKRKLPTSFDGINVVRNDAKSKSDVKANSKVNNNEVKKPNTWIKYKKSTDLKEFLSRPPIPLTPPTHEGAIIVDLSQAANYFPFEKQDTKRLARYKLNSNLTPSLKSSINNIDDVKLGVNPNDAVNTTVNGFDHLRQRGEWWFNQRLKTLTGSKLVNILGLFGFEEHLKTWHDTYDDDVKKKQDEQLAEKLTPEQANNKLRGDESMAWGTFNEANALATVVKNFPNINFYETTIQPIEWINQSYIEVIKKTLKQSYNHQWDEVKDGALWRHFAKSTPDAEAEECISNDGDNTNVNSTGDAKINGKVKCLSPDQFPFEFKCSYGLRCPKLWEEVAWYYYAQVQYHILTNPKSKFCYIVSWTPLKTRIWRINRDTGFWNMALPLLVHFHKAGLDNRPPQSLPDPKLSNAIKDYCKSKSESAIFIGEYESCFAKRIMTAPYDPIIF